MGRWYFGKYSTTGKVIFLVCIVFLISGHFGNLEPPVSNVLIIPGILLLCLSFRFSEEAALKRTMKRVSTNMVNNLLPGIQTKVVGDLILGDKSLAAPVTGRDCVAYDLQVADSRGDEVTEVLRLRRHVDFFALRVGNRDIEIRLTDSTQFVMTKDVNGSSSRELRAVAVANGVAMEKACRFKEGAFEPGETVAVFGVVLKGANSRPSMVYREIAMRPVIRAYIVSDCLSSMGFPEVNSETAGLQNR